MEQFDIEACKADLNEKKKQYNELLSIYQQIKSPSHPTQLFPAIEIQIYNISQSIQQQEILISNYIDLQNTFGKRKNDDLEEQRNVRTKK